MARKLKTVPIPIHKIKKSKAGLADYLGISKQAIEFWKEKGGFLEVPINRVGKVWEYINL